MVFRVLFHQLHGQCMCKTQGEPFPQLFVWVNTGFPGQSARAESSDQFSENWDALEHEQKEIF